MKSRKSTISHYIFIYFSAKAETDLNNINENSLITNYELVSNGFSFKDSVSEEIA